MIDEDEGLKYIEKKIMLRKRAVQADIEIMLRKRAVQADIAKNLYRNQFIEEVAKEVEKLNSFGKDTIDGLTIYIRNMKT